MVTFFPLIYPAKWLPPAISWLLTIFVWLGSAEVVIFLEDKTAVTFIIPPPNAQVRQHTNFNVCSWRLRISAELFSLFCVVF